jgi:hypothetical protein
MEVESVFNVFFFKEKKQAISKRTKATAKVAVTERRN